MPLTIEPIEMPGGNEEEAERLRREAESEAAREALARMAATPTPTSADVMGQVDDERVVARDDVLGPPARPVTVVSRTTSPASERDTSPLPAATSPAAQRERAALERMAADAQRVGDAYRADPANRDPNAFGLSAAVADDARPDLARARQAREGVMPPPAPAVAPPAVRPPEPPVDRARLAAALRARQSGAAPPSGMGRALGAPGGAAPPDALSPTPPPVQPVAAPPIASQPAPMTQPAVPPPQQAPAGIARNLGAPSAVPIPPAPPEAPPERAAAPTLPPDRERLLAALLARQGQSGAAGRTGEPPPPDYTGADWSDAIRRPLYALGAGLQALRGRQAPAFRSERATAEARYRADQQRVAQQRERGSATDLARERMELDRERLGVQREGLEVSRDAQERRASISEQMQAERVEVARERAEMAAGVARAQVGRIEGEAEREAAATDPTSEPSRTARTALRTALAGYPPEARARLAEQMGVDDLDAAIGPNGSLSMRAAEQQLRALPNMFRDLTNRRGGARAAGGSGAAVPTDDAGMRAAADGLGIGSAVVDGYLARGTRGRRELQALVAREQVRRARGGGVEEAGTEILPGVRTSLELPASEAANLRSGIASAASSAANLRGLAEVERRYGGVRARISPEAQAEVTPRLTVARGMVAQLGNTGVINPGEVPAINAALPDPGNLTSMTFGTFNNRMRTWQRMLEDTVRANLASRGVDDAGIARAIATIRTGSWSQSSGESAPAQRPARPAAPASSGSDTVRVRHPDGRTGAIPRANLQRALAAGFEEGD